MNITCWVTVFDIMNKNHNWSGWSILASYRHMHAHTRLDHSHTWSLVVLDRKQVTQGMAQYESLRQKRGQKVNQSQPLNQEEVVFLLTTKTNHKPGRCVRL